MLCVLMKFLSHASAKKTRKKKKKDKKRKKTKKTEGFKFRTYGPFSNDVAVKGLIITDS